MLGATQVPVVLSAAFGYKDMEEWLEVAKGKAKGHIYTRNSNPTIHVFDEKVRLLEDAEAATSSASGMGIISSTLFALLASGMSAYLLLRGMKTLDLRVKRQN